MWPGIESENGVGVKFDEKFWDYWGPTHMFYYNPKIFDDSKNIKSIFCMYLPYHQVKFREEEIAMGIHYECGEFGQHTVLFSYEEVPNIDHNQIWDYCVFENLDTEAPDEINLHGYVTLKKQNKMTEEEVYQNYLEDMIDVNDKDAFRELSGNIVKKYLKREAGTSYEEAYTKFLENIANRIWRYSNSYELTKKINDATTKDQEEFDKTILEIMEQTQTESSKTNVMKERYEHTLEMVKDPTTKNDLNSIFRNCRELLLQSVVQYHTEGQNKIVFTDEEGQECEIEVPAYGVLLKGKNQEPVFKEKETSRTGVNLDDDDDDFLR